MFSSVASHLPNPSLSFTDSSTGSDIFRVFERFLQNYDIPVCGATILVLAKRYPDDVSFNQIVTDLQENQVTISVVASQTPSGGGQHPEKLYNIASETNGACGFSYDKYFGQVCRHKRRFEKLKSNIL